MDGDAIVEDVVGRLESKGFLNFSVGSNDEVKEDCEGREEGEEEVWAVLVDWIGVDLWEGRTEEAHGGREG